ncbi:MAG: hypothetical protein WCY70_05920 [Methanoculleus sp.]
MRNNLAVPLLCSSAIYFSFVSFYLLALLGPPLPVPPNMNWFWGLVPTTFGFVSLAGTFLVLKNIRNRSKRWYLGVPHTIVLIVVIVIGPLVMIFGGMYIMEFLYIPLVLLPITSVGFFRAYFTSKRIAATVVTIIPALISIYAIFSCYAVVRAVLFPLRTSWAVISGLEIIYWLLLMPVVGLCYIASAFVPADDPNS